MAYFTYLIDNYAALPSTIAFLHPHQSGFLRAWHVDTPLHENAFALQHLQLEHVQQAGYVNLRCKWNPGCVKAHRKGRNEHEHEHVTGEVWQAVFAGTSTPPSGLESNTSTTTSTTTTTMTAGWELPREIGVACCAQFAVSRTQVLRRPREDYVRFRQWIMDTEMSDAKSGRVMEYLWHIIFGMEAVQ